MTSFDAAWTLFAPGTMIVARPFLNLPQLLRVTETTVPWTQMSHKDGDSQYTTASCWDWNGRRMVEVSYKLECE